MGTSLRRTLVLLPGLDGTPKLRAAIVAELSGHFAVVTIAYPADRKMDYADLTDWVAAQLPAEAFVLMAESFGGPIAIELAARRQAPISGLILVSTFARNPLPSLLAHAVPWISPRNFPAVVLDAIMMGSYTTPALSAALQQAIAVVPPDILQARMIAALRIDRTPRLREIACPAVCLVGSRDRLIRPSIGSGMKSAIPDCELGTLDAPHMLLETHPRQAAGLIRQFCDRLT